MPWTTATKIDQNHKKSTFWKKRSVEDGKIDWRMSAKSIHNLVKPNGFMLHFLPYQGAYNHGFYNYNPTFFFDLGKANNYKIGGLWITTIIDSTPTIFNIHNMDGYNLFLKKNIHPTECYIFVLFKSPADRIKEFIFPQQGIYFDKDFSKESRQLWDKYKAPNL